MRALNLFLTSSVRIAAIYALLFSTSAAVLFAFIYVATVRAIDVEIDMALESELSTLAEVNERMGLAALVEVVNERATNPDTQFNAYLLTDSELRPMAGNLPSWPLNRVPTEESLSFDIDEQYGSSVIPHLFRARSVTLPNMYHLLVAHGVERRVRVQALISKALIWGLAAALVLGIVGGLISGRRVLRRTGEIVDTTARIMEGDLTERITVRGTSDEIDRLAIQLNVMLDRIERLVEGMRTVGDNIAHDLRTPLARLHAAIELALTEPPDIDRYRQGLQEALKETGRVLSVFNALMSIAQARSGVLRDQMEYVDLGEVLSDILELYEPAIAERAITLQFSSGVSELFIFGHRQLLAQAFANLLDNAVKFTPEGGLIRVRLKRENGCATLCVADNGPGIPEELRDDLLKPYARGDTCGVVPGLGLGLSLVAAVAGLHSASLELGDNTPGLRVTLHFRIAERPVTATAHAPADQTYRR